MKHLLTSILLLSFCSSIFAQSTPPSGYSWTENPSNSHFYTVAPDRNILEHIDSVNILGRSTNIVTLRSQTEEDWVSVLLPSPTIDYFIGLTDHDDYSTAGTFVWLSGDPFVFENWSMNEPNDAGTGEFFVHANDTSGGWADGPTGNSRISVYEFIPGPPQTITVDSTGAGDFLDIQSAINFADNGDTILVESGNYIEKLDLYSKEIIIKSLSGPLLTVLGNDSQFENVVSITGGQSRLTSIEGFTIKGARGGSAQDGGGLEILNNSSPTIKNCIFQDNLAKNGGAIHCGEMSNPLIIDCVMYNNSSSVNGGAIHVNGDSYLEIESCNIYDNGSYLSYGCDAGGAIMIYQSSVSIKNSSISNNTAIRGGGLNTDYPNLIAIENTSFEGNKATSQDGGGVAINNGATSALAFTFEDTIFFNNNAHVSGGGLYASNLAGIILKNCTFDSNHSDQNGGGVYLNEVEEVDINSCYVQSNTAADDGAGAYLTKITTGILTETDFADNECQGSGINGEGGGLRIRDAGYFSIDKCEITSNSSDGNGGGFSVGPYANINLENSIFKGNSSNADGAAIELWKSGLSAKDCFFYGNNAGSNGQAIWINDSTNAYNSYFTNCTFSDNGSAAEQHVYSPAGNNITFLNTIYWNSNPPGSRIQATFSCFSDTGGNNPPNGTGNITLDPLFTDALNGNYSLSASSPCIDTGDPNSPLDPDGTRADMGVIPFLDSDGDGLSDEGEVAYGTDPLDQDTDDDGLSDGEEVLTFSTNPLNLDSDYDGLQDGTEVGNYTWWQGEPWNGIGGTDTSVNIPDADPSTTTNPLDDDTDNDGLMDGQEDVNQDGEFLGIELDPNNFDGDNDGLGDGLELGLVAPNGNDTDMTVFVADADPSTTTRASLRDTDGGGISDGIEDANRNGMIDAGEIDPRDASDDYVYMRISPMVEGGSVTFSYFGCEPGSIMVLCYSLAGPGPTFFTNLTLDLSQPIGSRPPLQINSYGTAQLGPVPIPPNIIVGDQIWFQGVQVSLFGSASSFTTTNMIPVTVQ